MQRRNFVKLAGALAATPLIGSAATPSNMGVEATKEVYEWRIYTLKGDGTKLDNFFKEQLIPAYRRKGATVGAFQPYKKEGEEKRYLLLMYPDLNSYYLAKKTIWEDKMFRRFSKSFYDTTAPDPLYSNFETYLSLAFDKIPYHRQPDSNRTLFELRIYQSPNEEANQRKVKMFNADEIDVFDKVGINSVCYGDVLAGPVMPSLLYLTWYKDEATRSEAWSKFGNHPGWIAIRDKEEYAHTATNNRSILLSPMDYSQI